jgi:formylglycine-generating enzyme required for sulfatase activity
MPKIFISYRREDSAGYAQAIYARLAHDFSKDRVFMDVDTISPGVDFERAIEKAVAECDVLVAVIGKRWMGGTPSGPSRFDDIKDYVRLEISTALARQIYVIPVLVDGMAMPSEDLLPEPLRSITRRHAIELSNTRFDFDVERLITAVSHSVGESEEIRQENTPGSRNKTRQSQRFPSRSVIYGTIGAAALIFLGLTIWWTNQQVPKKTNKVEPAKEIASLSKRVDAPSVADSKPSLQEPRTKNSVALPAVLSPGKVFRDHLKNGREGPEMVVIPAGSFKMGDHQGVARRELPVHIVRIKKSFAVGRFEVTFTEYEQFAIATNRQFPNDEGWGRGRRPVIYASWQDAVNYGKWLSAQTGRRYRLPSEAEWEYAARGGQEKTYWWGEDWQNGMANCTGCGSPWDKKTAPAGSFKSNPFGLYDTAGNVWEWVEECWHDNYSGAPADGSAWISAGSCSRRVLRGGSWANSPRTVSSASRSRYYPDNRDFAIGFRLVRDFN